MSFRARLLAGFGAVALIPLVVFGLRVRTAMVDRLTAAYQQRVAALVSVIRTDLERQSAGIAGRLDALKGTMAADNRFRVAAVQGGERAYLLDYAGDAMRLAGLAMLQIQLDERDAWSMNNLARVYIGQGRFEEALGPLARAIEIDSTVAAFHNNWRLALERSVDRSSLAQGFVEQVKGWR